MKFVLRRFQSSHHGFISLPIMLLLLFIVALSYRFYQQLASDRQWRYQQQSALNNQQIWHAFEMDIVFTVVPRMAKMSECYGFCTLSEIEKWNNQYTFSSQNGQQQGNNAEENLYWFFTKNSKEIPYYRLCARRQSLSESKCWWYKKEGETLSQFGYMPM